MHLPLVVISICQFVFALYLIYLLSLFVSGCALYAKLDTQFPSRPESLDFETFVVAELIRWQLLVFCGRTQQALFEDVLLHIVGYLVVRYRRGIEDFIIKAYLSLLESSSLQYCLQSLPCKIHRSCYWCIQEECTWDRGGFTAQAEAFLYYFFTGVVCLHENEPDTSISMRSATDPGEISSVKGDPRACPDEGYPFNLAENRSSQSGIIECSDGQDNRSVADDDASYDADQGSVNSGEDTDLEPEDDDSGDDLTACCKRDDFFDHDDKSSRIPIPVGSNGDTPTECENIAKGLLPGGIVGYGRRNSELDRFIRERIGVPWSPAV